MVRRVLAHYEEQTEDDALVEDEDGAELSGTKRQSQATTELAPAPRERR